MKKIKNEQEQKFILDLINVSELLSKDESEYYSNQKEMILEKYDDIVLKLENPALSYYFSLIGSDNKEAHKRIVINSNNSEYNYLFAKNFDRENFVEYAKVIINNKDSLYAAKFLLDVIGYDVRDDIINIRNKLFDIAIKGKDSNLIFDLAKEIIPTALLDYKYVIVDEIARDAFEDEMSSYKFLSPRTYEMNKHEIETEEYKQRRMEAISGDFLETGHHPMPWLYERELYDQLYKNHTKIYINELLMCIERIIALKDVTSLNKFFYLMGDEIIYEHFLKKYIDMDRLVEATINVNIESGNSNKLVYEFIKLYTKETLDFIFSKTYNGYTKKNLQTIVAMLEYILDIQDFRLKRMLERFAYDAIPIVSKYTLADINKKIDELKMLIEKEKEINNGIKELEVFLDNQDSVIGQSTEKTLKKKPLKTDINKSPKHD